MENVISNPDSLEVKLPEVQNSSFEQKLPEKNIILEGIDYVLQEVMLTRQPSEDRPSLKKAAFVGAMLGFLGGTIIGLPLDFMYTMITFGSEYYHVSAVLDTSIAIGTTVTPVAAVIAENQNLRIYDKEHNTA